MPKASQLRASLEFLYECLGGCPHYDDFFYVAHLVGSFERSGIFQQFSVALNMYVAAVGREYLDSERQPNCMPELLFRRHFRICKCVLLCFSHGDAAAWKMHRIVNNYFYLTKEEYVRHLLMSIGYSYLCLDITQFHRIYRVWDSLLLHKFWLSHIANTFSSHRWTKWFLSCSTEIGFSCTANSVWEGYAG